jgi:hypothetical protein
LLSCRDEPKTRGRNSFKLEVDRRLTLPAMPMRPRSRHLPVVPTEGSLTSNLSKIVVRLWTDRSFEVNFSWEHHVRSKPIHRVRTP